MSYVRERDYSKAPIGTKMDDAEIAKCPKCGCNGLKFDTGGKVFYTHKETIGFSGNYPVINWEWCEIESPQTK